MHALCFWKRFWEQLTVRLCIIAAVEAHHFSALVHTEPNRCKRGERFTSWRWRPHAFCVFLALIKVCVVSLPFLLPVGHFVGLWLPRSHCHVDLLIVKTRYNLALNGSICHPHRFPTEPEHEPCPGSAPTAADIKKIYIFETDFTHSEVPV